MVSARIQGTSEFPDASSSCRMPSRSVSSRSYAAEWRRAAVVMLQVGIGLTHTVILVGVGVEDRGGLGEEA